MLTNDDIEYISTLLHPLHVLNRVPLSTRTTLDSEYVTNSDIIYKHVLNDIKNYIKYVKQRDSVKTSDLEAALALRVFGVHTQNNELLHASDLEGWCKFVVSATNNQSNIPGKVTIPGLQNYTQKQIDMAVLKAVSLFFLNNASANISLLQNNVWYRNDSNVLTLIKYNKYDNIIPYSFDPSLMSLHKIETRLFKATKQFVKAYRKYPTAYGCYNKLTQAWLDYGGLIYSPAAASVSCVGQLGIEEGWPALMVEFNGIPVAITVCKLIDGKVNVCASIDHRAWSGKTAGMFYVFIKQEVPKILKEEI